MDIINQDMASTTGLEMAADITAAAGQAQSADCDTCSGDAANEPAGLPPIDFLWACCVSPSAMDAD